VLREVGLVCVLELVGTLMRLEGKLQPHCQLLCERRGRGLDLGEPMGRELDRRIEKRTGWTVLGHHLEFHGICGSCRVEN